MRRLLLSLALSASLLILLLKALHVQASHQPTPSVLPNSPPLPSHTPNPFHPLHLTECTSTTPPYYAPCLAQTLPHAASGKELLYPAFTTSPPLFAASRPHDAETWWNTTWLLRDRAYKLDTRLRYPEKHGQIYVFENVTLSTSTPFDKWSMDSCMSSFAPTSYVLPSSNTPTHESVLLANIPDSWSLQHFLDRAMRVVAQSRDYQPGYVAIGRGGDKSVKELWQSLGYPEQHVLHRDTSFVASQMIWSCRAPLVHPWLTHQSLSLLAPDSLHHVPLSDRKVILYMTRSNGLTRNGGRQVLNEDTLLVGIQSVLDRRGQKEKLEIFNHGDFSDMGTFIRYLQQNVKAVIGPHGSALHNHFWTASDTLVVEFQPTSRPDLTFYESAKMRDHPYVVLMEEPVDEMHNMLVDVGAVVEILEERLGRELEMGDRVRLAYDWEADELGIN
ncbi:hypothetical protein BO94DRAFT_551903 [Aspergillus sclerotioniger CBS 115572]|uniref:Glycosyltransferase 61 catalytic domain-containing protein n=1 Tax=Aspergillus sclerotioniger CBS 115572 TaxID=1450535 RepID=A0A317XCF2_9EURO|nr:hypothetical protein BO94DRAFT_551903 [Aspergillus sclerotioniger CBS 115572]PWY96189.1 hypothetical protein BO94DRAFT_551903 [Aspergillus sclerotioniger CBS 115572]